MKQNAAIEMWNNGPLPLIFKANAYLAANEFALFKEDALQYLLWCKENDYEVSGYEVWFPTKPGPTVLIGCGGSGNADLCYKFISDDNFEENEKEKRLKVVFNVWAEYRS